MVKTCTRAGWAVSQSHTHGTDRHVLRVTRYYNSICKDRPGDLDGQVFKTSEEGWAAALERGYTQRYIHTEQAMFRRIARVRLAEIHDYAVYWLERVSSLKDVNQVVEVCGQMVAVAAKRHKMPYPALIATHWRVGFWRAAFHLRKHDLYKDRWQKLGLVQI